MFNVTKLFHSIEIAVEDAAYVLDRAQFYMQLVDNSALTGAQKLDAVKQAIDADIKTAKPDLVPKFDALWASLAPAISGMVAIFRLTGQLAPIIKAAQAIAAAV